MSWSCRRSASSCWSTPSPGRQREVATGDLRVRTAYAEAAAAHRTATAEAVRAAGAGHLLLRTDQRLGARHWPASSARVADCRPAGPRSEEKPMTFLSPLWLLTLIPVAALALAYVVVQRRRHRYAVRFASLPMLDRVVPRRPGWRRHLPATLVLMALTCLGLAAARPELALRVPYDRATVMVAIDTSGSMAATDVPPNRLEAAKAAAAAFVEELPDTVNVGVVSFAGTSAVVAAPTTDHDQVQQQIAPLQLAGGGTAIGEAVFSSVDQVRGASIGRRRRRTGTHPGRGAVRRQQHRRALPRAGRRGRHRGRAAGLDDRVRHAGRRDAHARRRDPACRSTGRRSAQLAEATGGTAYTAESGEQLRDVYADIGSSIGWRTEQREVTPYLAALGLLVAVGAGALSLRWFSRLDLTTARPTRRRRDHETTPTRGLGRPAGPEIGWAARPRRPLRPGPRPPAVPPPDPPGSPTAVHRSRPGRPRRRAGAVRGSPPLVAAAVLAGGVVRGREWWPLTRPGRRRPTAIVQERSAPGGGSGARRPAAPRRRPGRSCPASCRSGPDGAAAPG